MLGISLNLPPQFVHYVNVTPAETMAAHILLGVGWFPLFGVVVWGMTHLWLDFKQEKYSASLKWINLEVHVPPGTVQTPKGVENFFSNMAGTKSGLTWKEIWLLGKEQAVFSFELYSIAGDIHYIIRLQDKYRDIVEADLYAQYPEAQITEVPDYAADLPKSFPNDETQLFGGELVLKKENFFPIRTFDDFEHQGEKDNRFKDPLLPLLEFMGKVLPGETLAVQILIRAPENEDWVKEGLKYLGKIMGREEKKPAPGVLAQAADAIGSIPMEAVRQITGFDVLGASPAEKKADDFKAFKLTTAEKIQLDSVAEKISKVGWQAKIRWVTIGPKDKFRKGIFASGMKGVWQPFTSQLLNALATHGKSVPKDDYFWQAWGMAKKQTTLVSRFRKRSLGSGATPSILNAEELATIWHFPAADARTPVLTTHGARRAEAPNVLPYAPQGEDSLPDWKKLYGTRRAEDGTELPDEEYEVPTPAAPTAPDLGSLPKPGLPAPLPPGLPRDEPPENLPVG